MFHIYGLNVLLLTPLRAGARVVSLPRFDMELVLNLIQREKITVAPLVPPIILGLTKLPLVEKFDLSSIKRIISGAAPLDAKTEAALQAKFPHSLVGQVRCRTVRHSAFVWNPPLQPPASGTGACTILVLHLCCTVPYSFCVYAAH